MDESELMNLSIEKIASEEEDREENILLQGVLLIVDILPFLSIDAIFLSRD